MVTFKLIDNRRSFAKKLKTLEDRVTELKREFMRQIAQEVVNNSPVDTGTYMDSHNIGEVGAPSSSIGKPQGQARDPYVERALERLLAQIDSLDPSFKKAYINNSALHGPLVEYQHEAGDGRPYAPYTRAREQSNNLFKVAEAKVMGK